MWLRWRKRPGGSALGEVHLTTRPTSVSLYFPPPPKDDQERFLLKRECVRVCVKRSEWECVKQGESRRMLWWWYGKRGLVVMNSGKPGRYYGVRNF